jgi:hypothetical protein
MADGERKMLFDIRGGRKNVIRVVYAVLALLMAASLLLVVGPFNVGELVGGGSTKNAGELLGEQAARIERRLAKDPKNEELLLALTRARINAGNAGVEVDPETGVPQPPSAEARQDFARGFAAWNRYRKLAAAQASPSLAQLVAAAAFSQAEQGSASYEELETNLQTAADAQRIVAAQRPSVGSLTSLAIYEYFNGEFAAGDQAVKDALTHATKSQAKSIEKQLAEFRKNAEKFAKQKKAFAKSQKGRGKEVLEGPSTGLGLNP